MNQFKTIVARKKVQAAQTLALFKNAILSCTLIWKNGVPPPKNKTKTKK